MDDQPNDAADPGAAGPLASEGRDATGPARADTDRGDTERSDTDLGDTEPSVDPAQLDTLAGQLVWRIGRTGDEGPITVRVGLASAASSFAELPKLRSASDTELRDAIDAGDLRVEWVGTGRGS